MNKMAFVRRSREDHILVFTMNSLIQNNQNLYVGFINLKLKKYFDFVDRELMLYL